MFYCLNCLFDETKCSKFNAEKCCFSQHLFKFDEQRDSINKY